MLSGHLSLSLSCFHCSKGHNLGLGQDKGGQKVSFDFSKLHRGNGKDLSLCHLKDTKSLLLSRGKLQSNSFSASCDLHLD